MTLLATAIPRAGSPRGDYSCFAAVDVHLAEMISERHAYKGSLWLAQSMLIFEDERIPLSNRFMVDSM